jgi:hypothetical protein
MPGGGLVKAAAVITTACAVLWVATLTSCSGTSKPPNSPSVPDITRVEIIAPSTLAPGATTQLRLLGRRSDGTSVDVTAGARFYSRGAGSSVGVLTVTPDGIATALKAGDTTVTGEAETLSSTRQVVVVPDGTFRVVGQVVEEGTPSLPVGDVRVEVDGAPPDTTNVYGLYRLYGVPGHARLRVSKDGYTTKELTLAISGHHTENVALAVSGPRVDAGGMYQLTFEASAECDGSTRVRDRIPDMLVTRHYAAAITRSGATIRSVLTGANFGTAGGHVVFGRAEQAGIVLEFIDYEDIGVSRLVETIDQTTSLVIAGAARLSPVGSGFTGTLDGHFTVHESARFTAPVKAHCSSPSHRVTLTR